MKDLFASYDNSSVLQEKRSALSRRQFLQLTTALAAYSVLWKSGIAVGGQEMGESRAIFDESLSWLTSQAAHNLCQRIKHAGFNVLMPNVWHGRGTTWPSDLAPWDSHKLEEMARSNSSFDPLDNLIKIANQYDIEVHPWFAVMLRQRQFFSDFYDAGTPENTFDVHRPEFRDFICNLMVECVSRYPIHGINLDYIRAGAICQSQACVADYRKATNRDLNHDRLTRGISGESGVTIAAWQERAVGDIVRRVSERVRAINPKAVVSVCAHPNHPNLLIQGQDSIKWSNEGLIDVIYAMHYEADIDWRHLKELQQRMQHPEALVVLCGNYDGLPSDKTVLTRDARAVARLLQEARAIGQNNGVGLYLYNMLSEEQINILRQTTFNATAKPRWVRAGRYGLKAPTGLIIR